MTDHDFADMVNPIGRMEREAEERGYRNGLLSGIFYALVGVIAIGMLLVAWNAHAETVWQAMTWGPVKASECGGTISACHYGEMAGRWLCYCVR